MSKFFNIGVLVPVFMVLQGIAWVLLFEAFGVLKDHYFVISSIILWNIFLWIILFEYCFAKKQTSLWKKYLWISQALVNVALLTLFILWAF